MHRTNLRGAKIRILQCKLHHVFLFSSEEKHMNDDTGVGLNAQNNNIFSLNALYKMNYT